MEKRVAILILSLFLLGPCSTAFAVTDGVYRLYESPFGWDGTYTDRAKAPSGDYDYTYGDESSLTFTLPWPFSFYGRSYSSINVDTKTGCTVHFNAGTPVTLTARSSEYSIFRGWGGDCLGTLPCALVMNMNKAVGVRFDRDTARSVRLTAVTTSYHSSLSSAYHAAPASAISRCLEPSFRSARYSTRIKPSPSKAAMTARTPRTMG